MNVEVLSNLKNMEALLAKKEKDANASTEKQNFGKEISGMSSDDPSLSGFVDKLKLDRIRHENRLRQEQFQRELEASKKIKHAKKIESTQKRAKELDEEKKYKAVASLVSKVNKDLNDVQGLMGKTLEFIDSNEKDLMITPRVQAKMQRLKRMLMAFYYGLGNSSVKINAYDVSK